MATLVFLTSMLPLLTFAYLHDSLKDINRDKFIFFIFFVILFMIFIGARIGGGHDYENYLEGFLISNQTNSIGLNFISTIVANMGFDFFVVTMVLSFIFAYFSYKRFHEQNILFPAVLMSFVIGFIFFSTNQIKQALVAAVFIYSLVFIHERRFLKYFFALTVSSFLFHISGLILLLLYFIPRNSINFLIGSALLVLAFILVKLDLVFYYYSEILKLVPVYGEIYAGRIDRLKQNVGSGAYLIYHIVIMMYILYHRKKVPGYLVNIVFAGTIFFVLTINSDLAERLSFYLLYLQFIPLALILKSIVVNKSVVEILIFFTLFVFMSINYLLQLCCEFGKHGVGNFSWFFG